MNYAHSIPQALRDRAKADLPPAAVTRQDDVDRLEPTHAERAKTLVHASEQGLLSTICRDPKGFPFGSVVKHAPHPDGHILLCLSDLAEHSKNLALDHRASLMIIEPPSQEADPLALARVTLLGPLTRFTDVEEDRARSDYLIAYPGAYFAEFDDFHMYRLQVTGVRYVGGFGKMSWINVHEYLAAPPDPLRPDAGRIMDHMNQDHAAALVAYSRFFGSLPETTAAEMTAVDRYGFELAASDPQGEHSLRIGFGESLSTTDEVRKKMVEMLKAARANRKD